MTMIDDIAELRTKLSDLNMRVEKLEGGSGTSIESSHDFPPKGKFTLSSRSMERMLGVHPDLRAVALYAIRITKLDFGVTATGGVRTQVLQHKLVQEGKSRTMNSRHLTGHALDVVGYIDGKVSWNINTALTVHNAFDIAAHELQVGLRWGGDWNENGDWKDEKFLDMYHHELPRDSYGDAMISHSDRAQAFLKYIGHAP